MASRVLHLLGTLIAIVVYLAIVMRRPLDGRDLATMLGLGFCVGVDFCRLIHWRLVGRHHAR